MAAAPDKDEALRRLRARAAERNSGSCELVIFACEIGDTIADLLRVMDLTGENEPPRKEG